MSSRPSSASSSSASGCPIDHSSMTPDQLQKAAAAYRTQQEKLSQQQPTHTSLPSNHSAFTSSPSSSASASSSSSPPVCDSSVLSSSIVGDNFPDSSPQPTQKSALSAAAVQSIIPRSGTDDKGTPYTNWTFPSPQRFFNAMTKKGWNPVEKDMPFVVSIHNTVNEQAWRQVLKYEEMHSCPQPKLLKFRGRPNDLSPKARLMSLFGYTEPFDRHDWTVDRCGKEVRYILDFYPGQVVPGVPTAASIHLDVRPALDSPSAAFDRLRMTVREYFK